MPTPRKTVIATDPGTSRCLGDVLVQDRQSHVAEQRRENRTLRGTGVGVPEQTILAEDARFEERLHQGQDAFVPDTDPAAEFGQAASARLRRSRWLVRPW